MECFMSFNITTSDLAESLSISPQRVLAISSDCGLTDKEAFTVGKSKYYSPSGIVKILKKRGLIADTKKRVIAFCNNKGGVGKSSTASNVALMLSSIGFKTLLIDSDGQANLTSYFIKDDIEVNCLAEVILGVKTISESIVNISENFDLLPSNLKNQKLNKLLSDEPTNYLKKLVNNLEYDFVIWDCNPSLDSTNQLIYNSCTDIFIVTIMENWSISGVAMTKELIDVIFEDNNKDKPNTQILINKLHTTKAQLNLFSKLQDTGLFIYPIYLDTDVNIPKSQDQRTLLGNKSKAFKAYLKLALAISSKGKTLPNEDSQQAEVTL